MNKRFKTVMTILVIIFIVGIIAYPKVKQLLKSKQENAGGGPMRGPGRQTLNVSGYLIKPQELSEVVNSTGTLRPDEDVDLSFETSGKIVSIKFTEGTRVKKGDLLAKINDKPLQAQLQKLLATKKLTEAIEFRQKSLLDKDAISQESYDQVVTQLQTTEADIKLVEAHILETELYAPFDGIIGLRYISEGAFATPSTKIARLIKISPLKVEFSIPGKYAQQIKPGFPITFKVNNNSYNAAVYAVDPQIDEETKTLILRALYPNNNEELKPGNFSEITLQLSKIDDAIAIPTEALIPEMDGEKVFVYRSGKAVSNKVNIGLRTESEIQILNGLNFGDTLITTGILQLREDLPVVLDTLLNNK